MKYLCLDYYLDYYDEKKIDALSRTELDAIVSQCQPYDEALRVASKHPAAHLGEHLGWGGEVRPIEAFEQL